MTYRQIQVDGQPWRWKVGRQFLDIRDPEGRGHRPSVAEVCGVTSDDVDEHREGVHVTPALVENQIRIIMQAKK